MIHAKLKIITLVVVLLGVFFVFGTHKASFLSSSVIESSFIDIETPENELIRIRLERINLIADKKEAIEEKQKIE